MVPLRQNNIYPDADFKCAFHLAPVRIDDRIITLYCHRPVLRTTPLGDEMVLSNESWRAFWNLSFRDDTWRSDSVQNGFVWYEIGLSFYGQDGEITRTRFQDLRKIDTVHWLGFSRWLPWWGIPKGAQFIQLGGLKRRDREILSRRRQCTCAGNRALSPCVYDGRAYRSRSRTWGRGEMGCYTTHFHLPTGNQPSDQVGIKNRSWCTWVIRAVVDKIHFILSR